MTIAHCGLQYRKKLSMHGGSTPSAGLDMLSQLTIGQEGDVVLEILLICHSWRAHILCDGVATGLTLTAWLSEFGWSCRARCTKTCQP